MTTAQKGVSFRPSDASAGGFFDDVDARILAMRVKSFDYNGQVQPPVCAISLMLQDVNNEERTTEQFYPIGPIDKFTPSADGTKAIPVNENAKIAATSNGMMLMGAFVGIGVPEDKIGDDLSQFDGGVFHFNQVAQPKRDFKGKGSQKENATILLPSKIVTLPWDVPAAQKKGLAKQAQAAQQSAASAKPTNQPQASAPVESNDAAVEEATAFVIGQLAANNGTLQKNALPLEAFKLQSPHRNAITQLVAKEDFLGHPDRPWKYANGTLSM